MSTTQNPLTSSTEEVTTRTTATTRPITTSSTLSGSFKLGCKVPDHNGPLGEGWEANSQYAQSIIVERRTNPNVPNGELDPENFGKWTEFATCLKNVLLLVEAQAYFKETEKYAFTVNTNRQPVAENGKSAGREMRNDTILAGGVIGSSKYASAIAENLYNKIKDKGDPPRKFHGAGVRYNEKADGSDSLVLKCTKFLPEDVRADPDLQPMKIQVGNIIFSYPSALSWPYLSNYKNHFIKEIFHYTFSRISTWT